MARNYVEENWDRVKNGDCGYHDKFDCARCFWRGSRDDLTSDRLCSSCRIKECKSCSNKASKKCTNDCCATCCKKYQNVITECHAHDTGFCKSCKSTGTRSFWVDGMCRRCRNLPEPSTKIKIVE